MIEKSTVADAAIDTPVIKDAKEPIVKLLYICKIIGDGLTIATAFRPALHDVIDPRTGFRAFTYTTVEFKRGDDGSLTYPWCLTHAAGPNHALLDGNPDVDALPFTLDAASASFDSVASTPARLDIGQKMLDRGIDTSFIRGDTEVGDIVNTLGRLHDETFNAKNFDVAGS